MASSIIKKFSALYAELEHLTQENGAMASDLAAALAANQQLAAAKSDLTAALVKAAEECSPQGAQHFPLLSLISLFTFFFSLFLLTHIFFRLTKIAEEKEARETVEDFEKLLLSLK
jgi:hypothetical protein